MVYRQYITLDWKGYNKKTSCKQGDVDIYNKKDNLECWIDGDGHCAPNLGKLRSLYNIAKFLLSHFNAQF